MNNTKHKTIDRIRKLLALSDSPCENEALLALEKAAELMKQHSIQEHELKENPFKESIEVEMVLLGGREHWRQNLLNSLSKTFNCSGYVNSVKGRTAEFYLTGCKSDREVVKYLWDFCQATIKRLAKNKAPTIKKQRDKGAVRKFIHSYKFGVSLAMGNTLREIRANRGSSDKETEYALAVLDHMQKVERYMAESAGGTLGIKGKINSPSNKRGLQDGFLDGKNIQFNKQVNRPKVANFKKLKA